MPGPFHVPAQDHRSTSTATRVTTSLQGKHMPSSNPRYRKPKKHRATRTMRRGDPCALCGKPIDYTLPMGHPMAYELDEIVPISRGGSPTDPDNLQATHAICNRRKGNRLLSEQLQVIERPMSTSHCWWECWHMGGSPPHRPSLLLSRVAKYLPRLRFLLLDL